MDGIDGSVLSCGDLELAVSFSLVRSSFLILVLPCRVLFASGVFAQQPIPANALASSRLPGIEGSSGLVDAINIDIRIRGLNGAPIEEIAVVTLTSTTGQFYRQGTTRAGYVRFSDVAPKEYTIQVVASGYEGIVKRLDVPAVRTMEVTVELRPILNGEDPTVAVGLAVLVPEAQKQLGKAMAALRANEPSKARSHLEAAYRLAPNHAEVNYFFGLYFSQLSDWAQARSYWMTTLDLCPKHLRALLSLSELLLGENKTAEALPLAARAVQAEPFSWRAHALLASVYLRQNSPDDAIHQAERAIELGHQDAALAQPLLAAALAKRGDKERATSVLQSYIHDHRGDTAAEQQLESLRALGDIPAEMTAPAATVVAGSLTLPSNWLPADIDDSVPPVEPNTPCALNEVLQKAGERMQELVGNVDRYTATESVVHQSIDKWGVASSPEARKFNYLVSISEPKPGLLIVEEYRKTRASLGDFPGGVETKGIPLLTLIFHPHLLENFEMACEGLARWSGGLAWQVHFRQRTDKPNRVKSFRVGLEGPSYPVALKGRAWIAADSYQIVRLETDLVAPVPEIRLVADHAAIEYGLVHFRERQVDMWLPKNADVYYDWRGLRAHRRHSFSNYLLFSVDDKQQISTPKSEGP